jgi:hypothetical protein
VAVGVGEVPRGGEARVGGRRRILARARGLRMSRGEACRMVRRRGRRCGWGAAVCAPPGQEGEGSPRPPLAGEG